MRAAIIKSNNSAYNIQLALHYIDLSTTYHIPTNYLNVKESDVGVRTAGVAVFCFIFTFIPKEIPTNRGTNSNFTFF